MRLAWIEKNSAINICFPWAPRQLKLEQNILYRITLRFLKPHKEVVDVAKNKSKLNALKLTKSEFVLKVAYAVLIEFFQEDKTHSDSRSCAGKCNNW